MSATLLLKLQAGPLSLRLENGSIRSVKWGETEVVRMIYGAARDPDWITLPPQIENERHEIMPDSFLVEFDVRYQRGEIDFRAHYRIRGAATGRIDFEFSGVAECDFQTNRVGLCVHLPLDECVGKPVEVLTGGQRTKGHFPHEISSHQPFFAIERLEWQPSPQCRAVLTFEGELFEAEDQRNWTDASFKIYCRPLDWPFPFAMKAGEQISQRISLFFEPLAAPENAPDDGIVSIHLSGQFLPLPRVGLGATTEWTPEFYDAGKVEAITALPISLLRAEVRLFENDWQQQWQRARDEAALLDWPLELVLWFGEEPETELGRFCDCASQIPTPIEFILLLQQGCKVTPDSLLERLAPMLHRRWPDAKIGGGTNAFFAELNRNRPTAPFDFAAFSINPQVHAEDDFSIVENLAAQSHVVHSARSFWKAPLHVGPITLRRRNNPDATTPMPTSSGQLPWNIDSRQSTLFAAGWTLGSLKYLAEAGAERITFYEVAGMRGLFGAGEAPPPFTEFEEQLFPLYFVFQELIGAEKIEISRSSVPLAVESLVVHGAGKRRLLTANLTNETKHVKLPFAQCHYRLLDETTYERFFHRPSLFLAEPPALGGQNLLLPPHALAILQPVEVDVQPCNSDSLLTPTVGL